LTAIVFPKGHPEPTLPIFFFITKGLNKDININIISMPGLNISVGGIVEGEAPDDPLGKLLLSMQRIAAVW